MLTLCHHKAVSYQIQYRTKRQFKFDLNKYFTSKSQLNHINDENKIK